MERRIASIIILIHSGANITKLNFILSKFARYIIGRMGVNLQHRNLRIIVIVVEASTDIIGALSGQLGLIRGIKVKTAILKTRDNGNDISSGEIQNPGQANGAIH